MHPCVNIYILIHICIYCWTGSGPIPSIHHNRPPDLNDLVPKDKLVTLLDFEGLPGPWPWSAATRLFCTTPWPPESFWAYIGCKVGTAGWNVHMVTCHQGGRQEKHTRQNYSLFFFERTFSQECIGLSRKCFQVLWHSFGYMRSLQDYGLSSRFN